MPTILLLSADEVFSSDLSDEIDNYYRDYNIIGNGGYVLQHLHFVDVKAESS